VEIARLRRTAKFAVVASVALVLPASPAAAKTSQGPACPPAQTVAALDQYCDSLPGSAGQSQPPGPGAGRTARPLSSALPHNVMTALRGAGPAARALLTIPAGGLPADSQGSERQAAAGARNTVEKASAGDAPTAVGALISGAPDVLGGAFRWGLVASTLGIAGVAWLRLRNTGPLRAARRDLRSSFRRD
jgi:hypothetical protein